MLNTNTDFSGYDNRISAQNKYNNLPASDITEAVAKNSGVIETIIR